MRNLVIAVMMAAAVFGAAAAFQAPDLKFAHYTTADGLPSNCVRAMAQDEDGFIWFGSDGGLVRFDGTSSKVFVPRDSVGTGDVYVLSLCRYGRGLLVGTDRMLYRYDPVSESLTELPLRYADGVREHLSGSVHDIAIDSKGIIWAAVEKQGVFRIEPSGTVTHNFPFKETDNYVGGLYVDPSDMVWALSNVSGGGIYRFDPLKGDFREFKISDPGNLLRRGVLVMTTDSHGDYWLGTWENGLVKFNPRTGEARQSTPADRIWNLWHIHSITEYSPTTLLIGSDSGLTLVDTTTGECKVYQADELDPQSLSDRFVYPVIKDRDGGLWVGTYYRGVNYVSAGSQRFRRWNHSRFMNSLSGNVVVSLCEDPGGFIWIGTADGGLCRYNPDDNTFRSFPLTPSGEPENVSALCADEDRIWVGTYSKGVGTIDVNSGRWSPVTFEGNMSYSCYAIHKDHNGDVWMGATELLTRYNPSLNIFEPVKRLNAWITRIAEDKEGRLWIATPGNGLHCYDPQTGEWNEYLAGKEEGSIPNNHIHSLMVDPSGLLYVSTPDGVCTFEPSTGYFYPLDIGRMAAQSVQCVGEELWISTSSGLVNIKPDGSRQIYGVVDGLSDSQFLPGVSLMTTDGKIYYGTVHGLSRVDPMQMWGKPAAPSVKFTGLDIVNQPVEVGDSHLKSSLNDIDELVLTHADHTFSVYFSALSYARPEANSYKYRLEGFDKTWLEAGKDNRATYSNLPPGTYTLHVKAANSDGVWNEEGVKLKIVVKPAWYVSTLMKFLYVIIGLGILLLIVKLILKRMERNHIIELDRISSNKEKEMFRSKLNFFTIVAHEIRTPVSLIIGPLEKILDSSEKFTAPVKEDLKIIDRNARRLLSLVNQLLDFKKVEDNALPMGFRHERVVPLVESVADRFRPSLEHKGITLKVDCPDPGLIADIDPEAITKLVSNLLNNARKFTKDSIIVGCRPLDDGERFVISVADNGIGITKENRDKIFKPFFQVLDNINESKGGTGLGLSIVKSVADAHGGCIELDSTPGKGSCFSAVLPLTQASVIPGDESPVSDNLDDNTQSHSESAVVGEDEKPVLLVVDDNEEMVHFVASHFDKSYRVVTAGNGREALDRMKSNKVGMIICDWMMPVMDGVEFLKAIRENENYSHIPFVMLTAKTDNTSKIETMRYGADAYVEKPFSISYLEARIDNLLEMRKRLREKYSHSPLEPITTLAPTQVDNDLLTRLQELIEEHLANPELNVDFLAEQLGISRSGLYDKIKSLADVTPHELIQLTRLKKAAGYLAEGKYRVQEVSYMVGISNSSYFSRLFQKQFGVRPSEFHK